MTPPNVNASSSASQSSSMNNERRKESGNNDDNDSIDNDGESHSKAVLVTGPHCSIIDDNDRDDGDVDDENENENENENDNINDGGTVSIESESLRVVDLMSSPTTTTKASTATTTATTTTTTTTTAQKNAVSGSFSSFFRNSRRYQEENEYDGKNMQELQNSEDLTHIVPDRTTRAAAEPTGFDVCMEYGYKYAYSSDHNDDDDYEDEDDDDDDDDYEYHYGDEFHDHNDDMEQGSVTAIQQNSSQPPTILDDLSKAVNTLLLDYQESPQEINYTIHVLGKHYHPIKDYQIRRVDETSLLWFTYRFNFPEILPYGIISDAGWGCMLRSAQMLLAQTLRMHFASREWKPFSALAQRRRDPLMRTLLTWFADYPSKIDCLFSLHNMVATGMAKYDKLPGEWYGPGTACYVLRDLCHRYISTQKHQQQRKPLFRVHVADSQGTVYRDAITELMCGKSKEEEASKAATFESVSHPLDPIFDNKEDEPSPRKKPWNTSLLLLIPLRLGLKQFQNEYSEPLAHAFSLPQSVGVLGGRPRGARWFYGATSNGENLYGLDPHTTQLSPTMRVARTARGKSVKVVALTDDYLRSVHTTNPECITLSNLDPSLALGFYCRDANDFEAVLAAFQKRKKDFPDQPELITIADRVPDYSTNESMMMLSMMSSGGVDGTGGDGSLTDDEDDFVIL